MKKHTLVFVVVALTLLITIGCASTTVGRWEATKSLNTIKAYEAFLQKYPDSEFSAEAASNLEDLYFQKATRINSAKAYSEFMKKYPEGRYIQLASRKLSTLLERWMAEQDLRVSKLETYEIGRTSEENFLNDEWNARDASLGNIGIIGIDATRERAYYVLGIVPLEASYRPDISERRFQYLMKLYLEQGAPIELSIGSPYAVEICTLTFEEKILRSIWLPEFDEMRTVGLIFGREVLSAFRGEDQVGLLLKP